MTKRATSLLWLLSGRASEVLIGWKVIGLTPIWSTQSSFPLSMACHSLNNIFQIVVLFWNYNITIFLRNFWRHAKLRTPTEGNTKKDQLGLSVARSEENYNELQKTIPKIIGLTLLV